MSSAKVEGVTATIATTAVIDRIRVVTQFLKRRNLAWVE